MVLCIADVFDNDSTVPRPSSCGGTYNSGKGEISFPGVPANYQIGVSCYYNLSVLDPKVLQLKFSNGNIGDGTVVEVNSLLALDFLNV